MEKKTMDFADYLADISPEFEMAVTGIHELMTGLGCTVKLQEAKSGHVVSYNHPVTKKVVANLVSRRTGPAIRIYGDNAGEYLDFLEDIPETLEKLLAKAPACKRLLDPAKCNARCAMGYDLTIKGTRHQKCRYNCFLFPVSGETQPFILEFLNREMAMRTA